MGILTAIFAEYMLTVAAHALWACIAAVAFMAPALVALLVSAVWEPGGEELAYT